MQDNIFNPNLIEDYVNTYYAGYAQLLVYQLKEEGFRNVKYEERNDILTICSIAENCLINTFEAVVVQLLTSFEDVKEFIHIYSYFSNPTNKKHISFRHTCRYILAIIPNLKLTSEPSLKPEDNKMFELCKLIAITNLLQSFIQAKAIQLIESEPCLSISINSFVNIDYTKDSLRTLNSTIANSYRPIHKNFSSEDDFSNLMSVLDRNSAALKTIFDYATQFVTKQADIFEVTREVNVDNNDPIISGLTFTIENVNLSEAIHSPYNTFHRTRFRPIIQLNIDGALHYYTTGWLLTEALDEICTNLIPYGDLPSGWEKVHELKLLSKELTKKLGTSFEDEVFKVISPLYNVKRNISGFHNISLKKAIVPNSKRKVGEIDFILIDSTKQIVYIIDAKCTKTKFYFQSFNNDKSTFQGYSIKLNDKVEWVATHIKDVGKFFRLSDLDQYSVEGLFVTNSLIYYSFFSDFPIIPLDKLIQFIKTSDRLCVL